MHVPLDLGPVRLHLFPVVPGREGEGRRLAQGLEAADAAVVAVDVDGAHAASLSRALVDGKPVREEPFHLKLLREEVARRYRGGVDDPHLAALKYCASRRAEFVPLLPGRGEPGFLARRRMRRGVATLGSPESPEAFAKSVETFLGRREKGFARHVDEDTGACVRRLHDFLFKEGASRVGAVLLAPRVPVVAERLRALAPPGPRTGELPRETARVQAPPPAKRYPEWR